MSDSLPLPDILRIRRPPTDPRTGSDLMPDDGLGGFQTQDLVRLVRALAPYVPEQAAPSASGAAPPVRAAAAPTQPQDLLVRPSAVPSVGKPPEPPKVDPLLALDVTNPLTALALLGSFLTRTPATTALNAAAGAMTAYQQKNDKLYEQKLASYHEAVQETMAKARDDQIAYRMDLDNRRVSLQERLAGLRLTATRRRDQGMLDLLDTGTPEQIEQRVDALARAGHAISPKVEKAAFIKAEMRKEGNEHMTYAEAEKAWEQHKKETKPGRAVSETDQAVEENLAAHSGDPTWTRAKSMAAVKAQVAQAQAEAKSGTLTPHDRLVETRMKNSITEQLDKIDRALGFLNKYVGGAGVAGRVTRLGEILGNITDADLGTDRRQFMRDIQTLRLNYPRIISGGARPMSAEEKRVDDIVPGLQAGDTTANTIRGLKEIRNEYIRRLQETNELLGGGGSAAAPAPSGAPAAQAGGAIDWNALGERVE